MKKAILAVVVVLVGVLLACELPRDAERLAHRSRASNRDLIIFSLLNWDSAAIQAHIAAYIVEHGFQRPTEFLSGNTNLMWLSLVRNDSDITMEIWLPNQKRHWDRALGKGTVIDAGSSLDNNWQAWVVPQYMREEYPNLVSVNDIKDHADVFVTSGSLGKARFVGCAKGWSCEEVNANKLRAYGLNNHVTLVSPPSAPALFNDLEEAYRREEPWIGYIWSPTQPAHELDLYRLEEDPYSDECWQTDQACEYPVNRIRIGVHSSLRERAPNVLEFLEKWDFPATEQVATEAWLGRHGETYRNAALWYLRTFREHWSSLVPADVAARVDLALAEEEFGKELIVFLDLDWESVAVQTRIAAYIVEKGFERSVRLVNAMDDTPWVTSADDHYDVAMEVWLPNRREEWERALSEGLLIDGGTSLSDNWQAWVVPQYVKDANPGLVSVDDIPEYAHLFVTDDSNGKARFVGCPEQWACAEVNRNKVEAYGLERDVYVLTPETQADLFGYLEDAYHKEEAWLGYMWHPAHLSTELELYRLEEPSYSDECWSRDQGCEYPVGEVHIGIHPSMEERAPDVVEFLRDWDFGVTEQADVESWLSFHSEMYSNGVLWYLQNYRDVWSSYVPSAVVENLDAALEEEEIQRDSRR